MSSKLNRSAYEQCVREDLDWLTRQPDTLERHHIEHIVAASIDRYYPVPQPAMTVAALITWLQSLSIPDAVVHTYDPEDGADVPVTGAVYDHHHLVFQTDVP